MPDIEPLRALHYDLSVVGPLADVVAPPYDVIDAAQREALLARSPFNVVAVDLPRPPAAGKGGADGSEEATDRDAAAGSPPDPYRAAGELFDSWQLQSAVVRDSTPAVWAHTQGYTGPDGVTQTRRGFFCRVRVEEYGPGRVRPHERTHPGPKEDRLRLTRATRANMSPIFSLYSDPAGAAWAALEPFTAQPPWGETTDGEGTVHRLWRVTDETAVAAVQAAAGGSELLIADGHHRYETARAYAEEVGGEGDHRYVLMCLVALEDPGLTVFPTHRLVRGLDDARREALAQALARDFDATAVPLAQLAPPPGEGVLQLGYIDSRTRRPLRLTLKSQSIADTALPGFSAAYRQLDAGVLEALLLKGALGLTDDDISHLHDFRYARTAEEAAGLVERGEYDVAFLLRPTPVSQVADVAGAGENMPPKSTFFYPKLLTGLLFNPL
ncbi:MAG TPA: DUF1015 domain-containing protein [Solirubrobacteraceae bacterium]|jgi:uncharacterized protein (DUF1015 family)|nr:DUF1015 domain-containing protein [Solirubrobacteraceae bacterium]